MYEVLLLFQIFLDLYSSCLSLMTTPKNKLNMNIVFPIFQKMIDNKFEFKEKGNFHLP